MKTKPRIILCLLFLILPLTLICQKSNEQRLFTSYFDETKFNLPFNKDCYKKLKLDLINKVTGIEIGDAISACPTAHLLLNDYEYYFYRINCSAGAYCAYHYMSIMKDDKLIKNEKITFDYSGDTEGRQTNISVFKNLLELEIYKEKDGEQYFDTTIFEYYQINQKEIEKISPYIDFSRKYYVASLRLLRSDELKKYTKDELDVMRNEIFAAHGYKFKSNKWQEYFEKENWYVPRYEDVTSKLTLIEQVNIENILNVASLK